MKRPTRRTRHSRLQRTAPIAQYTAVFEPDIKGGYTVTIPALPGCISEGGTFEAALRNIREAAALYISVLLERRRSVPRERRSTFTAGISVSPQ